MTAFAGVADVAALAGVAWHDDIVYHARSLAASPIAVAPNNPNLLYTGRIITISDAQMRLDWGGSQIRLIVANTDFVSIHLKVCMRHALCRSHGACDV